MTTASDWELMREVRAGRTAALATLFERHHTRLYRFCLRMTGNGAASEDIVQDVFMRMLKYAGSFRDEMTFMPWLFRIARNCCVDQLRRSAADRVPREHVEREIEAQAATDEDERAELIRKALLRLPVERREVLVLSRYEFKSYEEIAGTLGCSVGAVKVRAHRAMKQLREAYLELTREAST